jgi:DNA-3-methyladenine glycosylase
VTGQVTPRPVTTAFLGRDPRLVAPELLGLVVRCGGRAGRIVEVEAYCGAEDPASHTYRGRTPRNATMFGRAGLLYVYRSYGIHWCANVVCGGEGEGVAVLLRALRPLEGVEEMRAARRGGRRAGAPPVSDRDLCRGPGRLCQALGVTGADDGADLLAAGGPVRLEDDGWRPARVEQGLRVGISVAADRPWRWWEAGAPELSRGAVRQASGDALSLPGPDDSDVGGTPGRPATGLTSQNRRG